ncbi:MAG: DUF177 domain-containing protein [Dysgonamonadaceae bacterium]|nr:DUF177 domain-containing protein [Dysgonamonadaceae bacterium]
MGKFDKYKVDLKGMSEAKQNYDFLLDNQFFANIDGEEVQKGKVNVRLTVARINDVYKLDFKLSGTIILPCDRCLDDMDLPVESEQKLIVKLGKDYSDDSDEVVVIPESEGVINLAWFLYEFVALTIPIKHVHGPGKCNRQMSGKLKQYAPKSDGEDSFEDEDADETDDERESATDPRWDALKNFREEE